MSQQPMDPLTERLNDLILDVEAQFTTDASNQAVVSEVLFVNVFLPMFASDENPHHKATPEMWMNLAHGPFNEVTVCDQEHRVLFHVPPLASQDAIKPLDGTGPSARMQTVTDMVQTARLYANRGPNVLEHFILQEMDRRSFMFNEKTMSADHIRRWNEIFTRYNRPLLPVAATAEQTTSTNATNLARDSTEFDDLG
jgi:hypothetical protein